MSTELVQVNFHGDMLDAVKEGEKVWVSLRRCCENLGLDLEGQRKKLLAKPWAVVEEKSTTGFDGKTYSMLSVDLETLPGWLFSIDARKVKEHIREKLARYQKEAAKVLADHFFLRPGPAPESLLRLVHDMHAMLNESRALNVASKERIAQLESRLAILPMFHVPVNATPRFTIRQRLDWKGWCDTSREQRRKIYKLAVAKLDARHDETPDVAGGPGGGGPTRFYAHQPRREVHRGRNPITTALPHSSVNSSSTISSSPYPRISRIASVTTTPAIDHRATADTTAKIAIAVNILFPLACCLSRHPIYIPGFS